MLNESHQKQVKDNVLYADLFSANEQLLPYVEKLEQPPDCFC